MPYRFASIWIAFTLAVIVWGFWDSYFYTSRGDIPLGFHVHAISALAWVGLLGVQHWSIHTSIGSCISGQANSVCCTRH